MSERVKLIIFVPVGQAYTVWEAMGNARVGKIGNYSFCSFSSLGMGRFLSRDGAHSTIGGSGVLEAVEEERVETVCEKDMLKGVVAAIRAVHPYEEVAMDVYPLLSE